MQTTRGSVAMLCALVASVSACSSSADDPAVLVDGGAADPDGGTTAPTTICTAPIELVDTTTPTTVVGTGTPASCTEAALRAAIEGGGIITFACGDAPATIPITDQLDLRTDVDTTLDGAGRVTLDGRGTTRLFRFDTMNYRVTETVVTFQRLRFVGGRATGTAIDPSGPPPASHGFELDGGGAVIYVRDGILHVIDSVFTDNHAASLGPDVGGGAIFAIGSLGVTVVGSTFDANTGSNGGAIGGLQTGITVVNSTFTANRAVGHGANYVHPDIPGNHQGGAGGNGGAIHLDGIHNGAVTLCGSTFTGNVAGAFGGAFFRVVETDPQPTTFDRCTFADNESLEPIVDGEGAGAGALYLNQTEVHLIDTTLSGNRAYGSGGAIDMELCPVTATNLTVVGNETRHGLGGGIFMGGGNTGTITNATFAANRASGGAGFFSAAVSTFDRGVTVRNSIFADNVTGDGGSPMACGIATFPGGDSLQWPDDHEVGDAPDRPCTDGVVFADPELGALADHGGPTLTIAPAATSPAVGMGSDCPSHDQRGRARPAEGCTVGAIELSE